MVILGSRTGLVLRRFLVFCNEVFCGVERCSGLAVAWGCGEWQVGSVGMGQARSRILAQWADKHPLRRPRRIAIAGLGAPVAARESQLDPVGRALHPAMEALRIDKGFQPQQAMPEAGLPIASHATLQQSRAPANPHWAGATAAGSDTGYCGQSRAGEPTGRENPSRSNDRAPRTSGPPLTG